MEPNKKSNNGIDELNIVDVLCSTGYLPPRNVQDIKRFERTNSDRIFLTASHGIDADSIFDRVAGEKKVRTTRIRPMATIFSRPGALRVAQDKIESHDDSVANTFNQIIKNKQD